VGGKEGASSDGVLVSFGRLHVGCRVLNGRDAMASASSEVMGEIHALDQSFARHFNAGDAAGIVAAFASDAAQLLPPDHPLEHRRCVLPAAAFARPGRRSAWRRCSWRYPSYPGRSSRLGSACAKRQGRAWASSTPSIAASGSPRRSGSCKTPPQGPTLLVYGEHPDLAQFFRAYAAATDPYARWEKQQLREITGLDMNEPLTGPLAETLFEWHAG